MRRFSRLGAPVPGRLTRPSNSAAHTHLRRTPRSRPVIQQPSLPRDYQKRAPWRSDGQVQRGPTLPSISSSGRRREEASRHINLPLAQTQPSSSRHVQPTEPQISSSVWMTPTFPVRRPHRTRYSPSEHKRHNGHRGTSVEPSYDRAHEDYRSEYRKHRDLDSPPYVPPARPPRAVRPSVPATNRWSFSSESSTSSTECPPAPSSSDTYTYIPWSDPYIEEFTRELEYVKQQEEIFFRRRLEMEEIGWAAENPLLFGLSNSKPSVPVVPSNRDSLVDSCPIYEEDDVGQTTVYTNHEVIARDPRFAPPGERTRNLNGISFVQPSSVSEPRHEDRPKSRSGDETDKKKNERRRQRRTAAFPMWAEPAPRDMRDKERDGIRFRFVSDPDESSPISRARYATAYEEHSTITRRPISSRHSSSTRHSRHSFGS